MGSYNSVLANALVSPEPPTTNSLPLTSKVALWDFRAVCKLGPTCQPPAVVYAVGITVAEGSGN